MQHGWNALMACRDTGVKAAALLLGWWMSSTIAAAAEPNKEALIRDALSAARRILRTYLYPRHRRASLVLHDASRQELIAEGQ
jgi:hypothetical protein